MVSRKHRRVWMRLPARLPWATPLGQKIELAETKDVSRGGLLLSSKELHALGVPLWVTFPYDASLRDGQPEVLPCVVRFITSDEDSHHIAPAREKTSLQPPFVLAIHFEASAHAVSNGNGGRRDPERRGSPRRSLLFPFVCGPNRFRGLEKRCRSISRRGVCVFAVTANMRKAIVENCHGRFFFNCLAGSSEFGARVVRISPSTDGVALVVAVCRAT